MASVNVVLKSGTVIKVEDADSADFSEEPVAAGSRIVDTVRLVCKQGEAVVGRFDSAEIAGYSLEK